MTRDKAIAMLAALGDPSAEVLGRARALLAKLEEAAAIPHADLPSWKVRHAQALVESLVERGRAEGVAPEILAAIRESPATLHAQLAAAQARDADFFRRTEEAVVAEQMGEAIGTMERCFDLLVQIFGARRAEP